MLTRRLYHHYKVALFILGAIIALVIVFRPRPKLRKRSTPVFFARGKEIHGSYLVPKEFLKKFQTEQWRPILRFPCNDHDTFQAVTEDNYCSVGGLRGKLTVGVTGHNHLDQPVDAYEHQRLMEKPYRNTDRFYVSWVTLWAKCEFPHAPPQREVELLGERFDVDFTPPKPFKPGSVGICARAPFGDDVNVDFFIEFYKRMWSVQDIIVYDVGLTNDIIYHDQTVNMYPFLLKQYGSLAHDVLYMSWGDGSKLVALRLRAAHATGRY